MGFFSTSANAHEVGKFNPPQFFSMIALENYLNMSIDFVPIFFEL